MRIFIDADGCPVVDETVSIAKIFNIPVTIVKNYAHVINNDYAEVVTVDVSSDSADYYIVNHMGKNDIVVTQDNGLAAMALAKEGIILNQNGYLINNTNIDAMLSTRHINRELRQRGVYVGKAKKRVKSNNKSYEVALRNLLEERATDE
ncbi:MAG: DUF188 domain-containing protein [Gudongella sp.]|jgi:uncharacterized protein YaiI (UPF0178 family)|nr:DUF188 domain-containing protein [Gudongella sp.]